MVYILMDALIIGLGTPIVAIASYYIITKTQDALQLFRAKRHYKSHTREDMVCAHPACVRVRETDTIIRALLNPQNDRPTCSGHIAQERTCPRHTR